MVLRSGPVKYGVPEKELLFLFEGGLVANRHGLGFEPKALCYSGFANNSRCAITIITVIVSINLVNSLSHVTITILLLLFNAFPESCLNFRLCYKVGLPASGF